MHPEVWATRLQRAADGPSFRPAAPSERDFDELLTVGDVAAMLKVSKSWVYEHTRTRGVPRGERFPHVKVGKYLRFDCGPSATSSPDALGPGYAPGTTDHIHDVLSAVLRTAVKWGHVQENPARNVDLPALTNVRPKWALTIAQAAALLQALPPLPHTMGGLAWCRRGELFALRWRELDEQRQCLTVREAVCEGTFSSPKTAAGARRHRSQLTGSRRLLGTNVAFRKRAPGSRLEILFKAECCLAGCELH